MRSQIITNERGIAFSLDASISLILVILMLFIFLHTVCGLAENTHKKNQNFSLFRKAFSLSDLIIKTRNEEFPERGSACYDAGKKRVLENCLDMGLFESANFNRIEGVEISNVSFLPQGGIEKVIFKGKKKGNCITVERIVLANKRKAKLILGVCTNEK